MKFLDNYTDVSLQHLMAFDLRAMNLMGEHTGQIFPIRMKKECLFNVSTISIYELNLESSGDSSGQAQRVKSSR